MNRSLAVHTLLFFAGLLACSGAGSGQGTASGENGSTSGVTPAPTGPAGEPSTPCSIAAATMREKCPDGAALYTFDAACGAYDRCRAECINRQPCDDYHSGTCMAACPKDGSSSGSSSGGTSGSSSGSSGGGASHKPECVAYGSHIYSCKAFGITGNMSADEWASMCDLMVPKCSATIACQTSASCTSLRDNPSLCPSCK